MRIFSSVTEAYNEIERDLFEMGIVVHPKSVQNKLVIGDPKYDTLEIQNYQYSLTYWKDLMELFMMKGFNWLYVEEEFEDRISRTPINPGRSWRRREKYWQEFLNIAGQFDYSYSERLWHQVPAMIGVLRNDPDSRQAVTVVYDYHIDNPRRGGIKRIPCSIMYQALIRRGQLDLTYLMRSCDFYEHFPYDMALAIKLLEHIAHSLGVKPGWFYHTIVSLHAFRKDVPEGVF